MHTEQNAPFLKLFPHKHAPPHFTANFKELKSINYLCARGERHWSGIESP